MAGILGVGLTGLNAAQAGLLTAEHNISNAGTPGYHRQEVIQKPAMPLGTGSGFFGQGVQVETVRRIYSEFLDKQLMQVQATGSYLDAYNSEIGQIDNLLADPSAGLSPALQDFFSGVQAVANSPSSVPARQSMLSDASSLVNRFASIAQRLTDLRSGVNSQLTGMVTEINSYAAQIADLNDQIGVSMSSYGATQKPNDLMDQRDQIISELNKLVKVSVLQQTDGSYNVFIGNGQPLVVGITQFGLSVTQSMEDPDNLAIGYASGELKSSLLSGGSLGALLEFRDTSLESAQNQLGRIAVALSQTFNTQHRLGMDLNGNLGTDFFSLGSNTPYVKANSANVGTGVVTASYSPTAAGSLNAKNYRLIYSSATPGSEYTLTDIAANTSTTVSAAALATAIPGLTLSVAGTPTLGDSFLIEPTRYAARDIRLLTSSTAEIAAAVPIRTLATIGGTSSATISMGAVNNYNDKVTITFNSPASTFNVVDNATGATLGSNVTYASGGNIDYNGWRIAISGAPVAGDSFVVDHTVLTTTSAATATQPVPVPPATQFGPNPNLTNTVTITFTSPTTYDVSGTGTGNPTGLTYTAGQSISYNGWNVVISGTPVIGDVFTVEANNGGVSDGRNALALGLLQTANTMVNNTLGSPTVSFQGAFGQMVSEVGNKSREMQVRSKAQDALIEQTKSDQQSLSGVNLDEEAANLIRYQQAYQAAGKAMQIASSLFASLLQLGA